MTRGVMHRPFLAAIHQASVMEAYNLVINDQGIVCFRSNFRIVLQRSIDLPTSKLGGDASLLIGMISLIPPNCLPPNLKKDNPFSDPVAYEGIKASTLNLKSPGIHLQMPEAKELQYMFVGSRVSQARVAELIIKLNYA